MAKSSEVGHWGEQLAAACLQKKGYQIIEMNYRTRFGEIDLIASCGGYLAFVEVKLRKSDRFAQAREFVTPAKQDRIRTTALCWLAAHETELQPRFDVIEIYAPAGEQTARPVVRHLKDAFS